MLLLRIRLPCSRSFTARSLLFRRLLLVPGSQPWQLRFPDQSSSRWCVLIIDTLDQFCSKACSGHGALTTTALCSSRLRGACAVTWHLLNCILTDVECQLDTASTLAPLLKLVLWLCNLTGGVASGKTDILGGCCRAGLLGGKLAELLGSGSLLLGGLCAQIQSCLSLPQAWQPVNGEMTLGKISSAWTDCLAVSLSQHNELGKAREFMLNLLWVLAPVVESTPLPWRLLLYRIRG